MADTNVGALNHTVQVTHIWLKELAQRSPFGNEEQAYSGLRAVLHSLRDRLTVEEAVHFGAQLPMLVRGFYFEGWRPALAPNRERTPEDFFASVTESLRNAALDLDPEESTRTVFAFLEEKMDAGELRHVKSQFPERLQQLWPTSDQGQAETGARGRGSVGISQDTADDYEDADIAAAGRRSGSDLG